MSPPRRWRPNNSLVSPQEADYFDAEPELPTFADLVRMHSAIVNEMRETDLVIATSEPALPSWNIAIWKHWYRDCQCISAAIRLWGSYEGEVTAALSYIM